MRRQMKLEAASSLARGEALTETSEDSSAISDDDVPGRRTEAAAAASATSAATVYSDLGQRHSHFPRRQQVRLLGFLSKLHFKFVVPFVGRTPCSSRRRDQPPPVRRRRR
jgi:hypothetical protein